MRDNRYSEILLPGDAWGRINMILETNTKLDSEESYVLARKLYAALTDINDPKGEKV